MGHCMRRVSHAVILVPRARGAVGQVFSRQFNALRGLSYRPTVRHGDIGTNMPREASRCWLLFAALHPKAVKGLSGRSCFMGQGMTAFPSKADIAGNARDGRKVPGADIKHRRHSVAIGPKLPFDQTFTNDRC